MNFEPGQTVGDYEILGVLGAGGMGRVFRVRNLLSGRVEAMKAVLPGYGADPEQMERFLREIRVHATLEHPNIAALRTALRLQDQVVMIMELVEGPSLAEVLRGGPLSTATAVAYAADVLAGLSYAHARGVVHRDIKPANLIVAPEGTVKMTDFGIARAGESKRITKTGLVPGSLYYIAPEQINGGSPDARSDLYSFGVTLYEMLTGALPFAGDNEYAVMHAHLTSEPVPPSAFGVPVGLSDSVLRAMAKDPQRRFASADEFRRALTGGAVDPPPAARLDPDEVRRIEVNLTRAMGPIASRLVSTAARRAVTVEELRRVLAEQLPDDKEREEFVRACATPAPPTKTVRPIPVELSQDVLEQARRSLALFLGPVAKILVERAARKVRTPAELYAKLASEIPAERDRAAFLSSAPL